MTRPTLTTPAATKPPIDLVGEILLWLGAILTLLPQLLRATSNSTSFPFWDQDPLTYSISAPALAPADSILIDAATLLGAALLFARAIRQRIPINLSLTLLAIIGSIAVVLHGWFISPTGFSLAWVGHSNFGNGSFGNQRVGASWLSAIFASLALWHAAQDLRLRHIFAGTLLGSLALLACYGFAQVYFIHAQTMADFKADPDRFITAHGWTRDSSMAKSFIRRLSQPEASGWFGLSNVYATFAAAGLAAGLFLLWHTFKNKRTDAPVTTTTPASNRKSEISNLKLVLLLLFTLLSALALFLAHSKGGNLAFAGALAATLALFLLSRRAPTKHTRTLATLIGLAAIIAPILLIFLRGQLGENAFSNERSLLFRSFYADASVRIFADHPLLGVGPDGYQRAFTIAKPPLCPEEVLSPHCIPLDWLADLGILGLAWVLLLARFAMAATRNVLSPKSELSNLQSEISSPRNDTRLLLALPVLATLLATFLESPYITPDIAAVRIGGLLLWCLCAWAIAKTISNSTGSRLALTAAALAAIAHAQIDVAGSFPISAPLWLMFIALAASPASPAPAGEVPERSNDGGRVLALLPIVTTLALSILLFTTSISRTRPWQAHLEQAAATVRPISEISERLRALSHPPILGERATDSIEAITRDLRTLTSNPALQPTQSSISTALMSLHTALLPRAADSLERAFLIYPDNRLPLREASRLHLQLAAIAIESQRPEEARAHFDRAIRVLRLLPQPATSTPPDTLIPNPSGPELQWLASILERRSATLNDPDSIPLAITTRLRLTTIDPYNLDNALKLFRLYSKSDPAEARRWAARTLELHEYTRLDRETRGLSPADLADIRSATTASPPP